jgi:sugar lactone lactonase YvrE
MEFASGIDVAPDGTVYVSQDTPACIQRFAPSGMPTGSLQTGLIAYPRDVAVDADGDLYVAGEGAGGGDPAVHKYQPDGTLLARWPLAIADPSGIAVDAAGTVYVSSRSAHQIAVLGPNGAEQRRIGAFGRGFGGLSQPRGLAVDGARLYVAEDDNERVQAFSPASGAFVTMLDGEFNHPQGVALDCHGNVFVIDTYHQRVAKYAPGGPQSPCTSAPVAAAAAAKPGFEARFTVAANTAGTVRGTVERGARQRGTFTFTPRGRAPKRAAGFARGKWYARFDVRAGGNVRATGTLLAVAKRRRVCLAFTTTLSGGRIRGRFTSLGGDLRLAGSFDQRVGTGREWVLRGTSRAGTGRAQALPRRCRAVR